MPARARARVLEDLDHRVPVELWIEEEEGEALLLQRAANLSPRGAVFAHTVPRSPGSRVRVRFTLPGEADPVQCEGEIVAAEEGEHVGVRFLDLSPDVRRRIARLVAGRA